MPTSYSNCCEKRDLAVTHTDDLVLGARQSLSHFKEFTGLSIAAGCLQSMETGESIMSLLQEVAGEIERRVLFNGDRDGLDEDHKLAIPTTSTAGNADHPHHHRLAPVPVDFSTDLSEFNFC